eukprot:6941192-Pyramimonas_sp.AAC.1
MCIRDRFLSPQSFFHLHSADRRIKASGVINRIELELFGNVSVGLPFARRVIIVASIKEYYLARFGTQETGQPETFPPSPYCPLLEVEM